MIIEQGDRVFDLDLDANCDVVRVGRDGKTCDLEDRDDNLHRSRPTDRLRLVAKPRSMQYEFGLDHETRERWKLGWGRDARIIHKRYGYCVVQNAFEDKAKWTIRCKDAAGNPHTVDPDDLRLMDERDWSPDQAGAKQALYAAGKWHRYRPSLALLVSPSASLLLQFLVNWQQTKGKRLEEFYCPDSVLMRRAFLSTRTATRAIAELRKAGYISTRTVGPAHRRKRYITIEYVAVLAALAEAEKQWVAQVDAKFPKRLRQYDEVRGK
jgi:hypothetical protein